MPSLQDLMNIAQVAGPVAGGLINSGATSSATGNVVQGSQQAQGTITAAQQAAQQAIQNEQQQNNQALSPFQPGGSAATGLQAANAALLQPYQDAGTDALKKATAMTTPGSGYQIQQDPSYQWRLQQGEAAINAGANAGGTRFSGATLKSLNDYAGHSASQEFQNEFGREMGLVGVGQNAANEGVGANLSENQQSLSAAQTQVGANVQVGNQTVTLDTQTAQAIANLQQQAAEAQARGDIAQGNNINSTINSILQGLTNKQGMSALQNMLGGGGGPTAAGVPGQGINASIPTEINTEGELVPAGSSGGEILGGAGSVAGGAALSGGTTAAAGASLADVAAGAVPEIGSLGATGAGAAGAATSVSTLPGAAAVAPESAGFMPAVSAFLANPITIGVGAALIGGYALIKGLQTHGVADDFVHKYQDTFVNKNGTGTLNKVVDGFDRALASGQLTKAQAQSMRDQTAQLIQQWTAAGQQFAKKGDKQASVFNQAMRTMAENFGGRVDPKGHNNQPDWSKILGKMDQEIQQMAA